jgi:hypothetical protein
MNQIIRLENMSKRELNERISSLAKDYISILDSGSSSDSVHIFISKRQENQTFTNAVKSIVGDVLKKRESQSAYESWKKLEETWRKSEVNNRSRSTSMKRKHISSLLE